MRRRLWAMRVLATLALVVLLGPQSRVATAQGQAATGQAIGVQTSWGDAPWCYGGAINMVDNAKFHLSNIPANTVRLRVNLFHVDAGLNHNTLEIPYGGAAIIPARTFK